MDNKDQPIYPCIMQQIDNNKFRLSKPGDDKQLHRPMAGLTKREYFAAMSMQGMLSNPSINISTTPISIVAQDSLNFADALLNELEK